MTTATISLIEALDDPALFQPWFTGPTWSGWRAVLKAAFAIPLSESELKFFRGVAERDPPAKRVRELWIIAGRRAGKDSIASVVVAHTAALFNQHDRLRPGERALVPCLAVDRDQAKIVLRYVRAFFTRIPFLKAMVTGETANGFELDNAVDVAIATNSFRSTRGRPIAAAVFDEVAFWRDEASATPDEETYRAIMPGMATLGGAMLIGISSPYRRTGLLWRKFHEHYGRDGDVLVIKAPSIVLNPTLDQTIIDQAIADDPAAARSEWLGEFRDDIESFVSLHVIESCTVSGRHELPRANGVSYVGFVDPSGGSADSMTLAVAHKQGDGAVLDCVREMRPPFSPQQVAFEFAALLKSYGIHSVKGDRYAGEWPREAFRKNGIEYVPSEQTKNELYLELLPALNSHRVELLDIPRLASQLYGLERRVARSGRDSIDHAPGGRDDVANAAAGAIVSALGRQAFVVTAELLERLAAMPPRRQYGRRMMRLPPGLTHGRQPNAFNHGD